MTNPAAAGATVSDTTATYLGGAVTVSPIQYQTNDRWGNALSATNALGATSNYRYDQKNQLIEKALPSIAVTQVNATTGQITNATLRPTSENHYDALGRLVAKKDANGFVSSVTVNTASQIISEMNADGTIQRYQYDLFGNRVLDADELNNQTRYTYNQQNLQTKVEHALVAGNIDGVTAANIVSSNYQYDEAGRRILDQDAGYNVTYWYDQHGNVRKRNTPMGNRVVYTYDVNDHKLTETNALDGRKDWTYDYFGRVLSHHELGTLTPLGTQSNPSWGYTDGVLHNYYYDNAGQFTYETSSAGKYAVYTFDASLHLTGISETGTAVAGSGLVTVQRQTNYTYDIQGRKVRERVTVDNVLEQNATIRYDAADRMTQVWDLGAGEILEYDAEGNQTHLSSLSNSINGAYTEFYYNQVENPNGPPFMGNHSFARVSHGWYTSLNVADTTSEDTWYRYDSMNRLKVSRGWNTSGFVSADTASTGKRSIEFDYYANGDRKSQRKWGETYQGGGSSYSTSTGSSLEEYSYDGMHRLTGTKKDNIVTGSFAYDGASHQTSATTYVIRNNQYIRRQDDYGYDADGKQLWQNTQQNTATNGALKMNSRIDFGASTRTVSYDANGSNPILYYTPGTDLLGNVRSYTVKTYNAAGTAVQYTNTYVNQYRPGESYQLSRQDLSGTTGGAQANYTLQYYDLNGNLAFTSDNLNWVKNRAFTYDAMGNMLGTLYQTAATAGNTAQFFQAAFLSSTEAYWTRNFFANGKNLGSIDGKTVGGPANTIHIGWSFNIADGTVEPSDQVSAQQVITQAGDTLRTVAQRIYGDASLWYLLGEANAYSDPDQVLGEGIALTVPNQVVNMRNTSDVFRPFDTAGAIGDTSPTFYFPLNPEFKEKHCETWVMIVVAIVMIIVEIYLPELAPALFEAIGGATSFAGVAVTAAVASAAGQLATMALTGHGKFDWTAVALAAVSAGIMKGASGLGRIAQEAATAGNMGRAFAYAAMNSALNNAVSQGLNIIVGRQDSFNWRAVAVSGLAGGAGFVAGKAASDRISDRLGDAEFDTPAEAFDRGFGTAFASGMASMAVNVAAGGKVDTINLLVDSFGQALGSYQAARMNTPEARRARSDQSHKISDKSRAEREQRLNKSLEEFDRETLEMLKAQKIELNPEDLLKGLPGWPTDAAESGDTPQRTHVIGEGETLWDMAREEYGAGHFWTRVADMNAIGDPWIVHAGDEIALPNPIGTIDRDEQLQKIDRTPSMSDDDFELFMSKHLVHQTVGADGAATTSAVPPELTAALRDYANSPIGAYILGFALENDRQLTMVQHSEMDIFNTKSEPGVTLINYTLAGQDLTARRVAGDQVETDTLDVIISHEIGHSALGRAATDMPWVPAVITYFKEPATPEDLPEIVYQKLYNDELRASAFFENSYRQWKGLPLRRSYAIENDVRDYKLKSIDRLDGNP